MPKITFNDIPIDIQKQIYEMSGCFFQVSRLDKCRFNLMSTNYLSKEKMQWFLAIHRSHVLVTEEDNFYLLGKVITYSHLTLNDEIYAKMEASFPYELQELKIRRNKEISETETMLSQPTQKSPVYSGVFHSQKIGKSESVDEENHIPLFEVKLKPGLYKNFAGGHEQVENDEGIEEVDTLIMTVKQDDILQINKITLPTSYRKNMEIEIYNKAVDNQLRK